MNQSIIYINAMWVEATTVFNSFEALNSKSTSYPLIRYITAHISAKFRTVWILLQKRLMCFVQPVWTVLHCQKKRVMACTTTK